MGWGGDEDISRSHLKARGSGPELEASAGRVEMQGPWKLMEV